MKDQVDYSLYLVTDSTEAILGSRDLVQVVEQALLGGVTVVQYRDKTSDTGDLIKTGKALHEKCRKHNVPLVINDRVDVALAVGCEGVHLGQDDMNVSEARKLLGDDKIIGATVSSIEEARIAVERGADYLGIGTLYATSTKKNTKDIIGINGIRRILRYLDTKGGASKNVKTVCIGGVNALNVQRVHYQLHAPSDAKTPKSIDGVAVVSAIIGAEDVEQAAANLKTLLSTSPNFITLSSSSSNDDWTSLAHIQTTALAATKAVHAKSPLSHNMTNLVVQNFAANVALAIGASPIMSNNGAEAPDLAKLGGGLVINMGTATPDALLNHRLAIAAYNATGSPIVLDPVGAGATSARRDALAYLLASGYFTLIKGNEREILAVAQASGFTVVSKEASQQRGVDSGDAVYTLEQRAYIVKRIALRERNVVLMTGATDVISDGHRTYAISNGHKYLGLITGSGCTLGTTISAYMAASPEDTFMAAVAGILHYEIAAEDAAMGEDVRGPGTFIPHFIDALFKRRMDVVEGKNCEPPEGLKIQVMSDVQDASLLKEL
ncbi:thiamine biosynthetic bifunctional enzyme [Didymosphaeria variabile]|uniref:Thiamine biosynthetic bifunctional enzyme n=1 Tax=Didymosphaeria variabile TaxID=1932322 RepID=A0A9W8XNJ8_9PLEO|nr:thiamine biosynthetic bifunctional enzyme [Didymosphaeria variabile]KAJ4355699.1 thiamine biosynthetic bifunctional enzyme [Didymosphaeria variabile]